MTQEKGQETGATTSTGGAPETLEGPMVYVASLADYNAGRLHGVWLDATQDAESLYAEVAAMLRESREPVAEEWAIHDHSGFHGLKVGEYDSLDTVSILANLVQDHGEAFAVFADDYGTDCLEVLGEAFLDAYRGEYDSLADFAAELVESAGDLETVPEWLRGHIDYDSIARDLECGGDYWYFRGYVFARH